MPLSVQQAQFHLIAATMQQQARHQATAAHRPRARADAPDPRQRSQQERRTPVHRQGQQTGEPSHEARENIQQPLQLASAQGQGRQRLVRVDTRVIMTLFH
ncbi:hypothetical protein [Acidithiobacillus acidisediminis]|uniref:hypothetical protein n=1 Tax=Acidithiobacillus TaxID=119977 RepID=UPI0020101777|nr:hypothetical protein [Acidithiobacillus sp. S30A2]